MFSFDDVRKRPQRIKSVTLTTVNTNPAICREMWALLQNDGDARILQWARDALPKWRTKFTGTSESARYVWRSHYDGHSIFWTQIYMQLYVPFLIHHLHISLRTAATVRRIFLWWYISNNGTGKKRFYYDCRTCCTANTFGVARRTGRPFVLHTLTQQK